MCRLSVCLARNTKKNYKLTILLQKNPLLANCFLQQEQTKSPDFMCVVLCKFKSHSALNDNEHSVHAKGRAGGGASSKNAIKLFVSSPSSSLLQLET